MIARTPYRAIIDRIGTLRRNLRAVGAVEFALAAPFLILLYLGGYQLMDVISAYRKVTITVRALADLTTRSETLTQPQALEILNASRQIMTPYSTNNAILKITQIKVDKDGKATVDWSVANAGALDAGTKIKVPNKLAVPNSSIILSQIIYGYKPAVAGKLIGPLTFTDQIYMNPRRGASIPLNP